MNVWQERLAVQALRRGGLVMHATEGVWGFACDPFDADSVHRLLAVKGRPGTKGLIVIGADARTFEPELDVLDAGVRDEVVGSWPGPVTWILPNVRFPRWISGGRPTVAVRVPGHEQARELARAFGGPLVSTSANPSRRPAPRNRFRARWVLSQLRRQRRLSRDRRALYLLPGETTGRRRPSDIRSPSGAILRGAGARC